MTGMMQEALRWIFWGILYLAIVLVAMIISFGMLTPYFPNPVRWAIFATFLYGIALDVRTKAGSRTPSKPGPPSGGDLEPSHARGR